MRLKIIIVPDPILRKKSKPIKKIDSKVEKFVRDLEETIIKKKNPSGVGLSAPQVGKLWRIFTTNLPQEGVRDRLHLRDEQTQGSKFISQTYINPEIVKTSKKMSLGGTRGKPFLEGCLSIPAIYGAVPRHQWIDLKWLTIEGFSSDGGRMDSSEVKPKVIEQTKRLSDFTARVIQHELDHLDGILFTDRTLQAKLPLYEDKDGKLQTIEIA